ncbi:hypothetical protein B0O80DRAFT_442958, partial [Mortierella sp. GBAus27b]
MHTHLTCPSDVTVLYRFPAPCSHPCTSGMSPVCVDPLLLVLRCSPSDQKSRQSLW